MNRNKLYALLSIACLSGYIWLAANYSFNTGLHNHTDVCLFKYVTGIPCPSCGTTRSMVSIFNWHIKDALTMNPFGFIVLAIMCISPVWIGYDLIRESDTLFRFYKLTERWFCKKHIAIPAILLVLLNWTWNICKGL